VFVLCSCCHVNVVFVLCSCCVNVVFVLCSCPGPSWQSLTVPFFLSCFSPAQEYLCGELERATKKKDQLKLKEALALATAHGMLPVEKPVHKASHHTPPPSHHAPNNRTSPARTRACACHEHDTNEGECGGGCCVRVRVPRSQHEEGR
jgi:hypothetical protein